MNYIAPYTIAILCCVLIPRSLVAYFWSTGYEGFCSSHTNMTILFGALSTNVIYLILLRMLMTKKTNNIALRNVIMLLSCVPLVLDTSSCIGYKIDCNYMTTYTWISLTIFGTISHIINSIIAIGYTHRKCNDIPLPPDNDINSESKLETIELKLLDTNNLPTEI